MTDVATVSADAVYGVLFGGLMVFALQSIRDGLKECDAKKSIKAAICEEIKLCGQYAYTFLNAGIKAPLYRLPTANFYNNFPALLQGGGIDAEGARALVEFYAEVDTFNRGLDDAAIHLGPGSASGSDTKKDIDDRNRVKASRIQGPSGQHYSLALEAVS